MKRSGPDHTGRAKERPSPACRQKVHRAVGPLMGGTSRGGATGVGQAVAGPLAGATFPECTAAIKAGGAAAASR